MQSPYEQHRYHERYLQSFSLSGNFYFRNQVPRIPRSNDNDPRNHTRLSDYSCCDIDLLPQLYTMFKITSTDFIFIEERDNFSVVVFDVGLAFRPIELTLHTLTAVNVPVSYGTR